MNESIASKPQRSRAPSMWSILSVLIVALWIIDDNSRQVAMGAMALFLLFFGGAALSLHYLYCLTRMAVDNSTAAVGAYWRWCVLPCAAIIVISALATYWPMRARFALSESAFRTRALEFQKSGKWETGSEWVGQYWVKRIHRFPNGDIGFTTGASIIDPVGITYCPSNPPPSPFNMRICKDWYAQEW